MFGLMDAILSNLGESVISTSICEEEGTQLYNHVLKYLCWYLFLSIL